MKRAIVVGSGAGGATAAKELQGKFQVKVLEAGNSFHPFAANLSLIEKLKKSGLFFDERLIQSIFSAMKIRKTVDKMVLVNGITLGGSTTLSAGNAVRCDKDLQAIGIDLDAEFEEIYREIPISTQHRKTWHKTTTQVFAVCQGLGLQPEPTPKMAHPGQCNACGRCVLGCPRGAKWDSRVFLNQAVEGGAQVISNCRVRRVVIENGKATGALATRGWQTTFYPADLIVLAAGGLGTPVILQNSGIECQSGLFVDPVLCVAAKWEGSRQNQEISMPFIVQREHFIISPYFDFLSFFFNSGWKLPAQNTYGLMIKLADANSGSISRTKLNKTLTDTDKDRLQEGISLCKEIFHRTGIDDREIFLGTLNAGHPGGMLPLTENESSTLHNERLPENLYVADASLFPASLGNPPILTIVALAKRISRLNLKFA
jgi:choline dehydrogenase-like flavoprotein